MTEMRLRVRDAIAKALDPLIEPGRTTTLSELAEGCVPAVLGALREPTEAMTEAMHLAWDRREFAPGPFTLEKLWRAGVGAALADLWAPVEAEAQQSEAAE